MTRVTNPILNKPNFCMGPSQKMCGFLSVYAHSEIVHSRPWLFKRCIALSTRQITFQPIIIWENNGTIHWRFIQTRVTRGILLHLFFAWSAYDHAIYRQKRTGDRMRNFTTTYMYGRTVGRSLDYKTSRVYMSP